MRAAAILVVLALAAVLGGGCQPASAAGPLSLRPKHGGPFTCELDLRDPPCIVCLKQRCCELARACDRSKESCPCWLDCLGSGNTPACAARCAGAADRAMAECSATACQEPVASRAGT